jgi:phosphoglucomutase
MDRACAYADQVDADIVMACDPDADRLGLMAQHPLGVPNGEWRFFTGNEIACLAASYLLTASLTRATARDQDGGDVAVLERVAPSHGARDGHLLVGFKHVGTC